MNLIPIGFAVYSVYGQASFLGAQPIVNDPSLKADLVFQGLQNPTSMAFLGPNDILVLEKDQGAEDCKWSYTSTASPDGVRSLLIQ